uniref:Uncharacterized protein n=1 Tax=Octopus bimaculoides TaxID=37653 RepID=A0A0L8I326_OCTBM
MLVLSYWSISFLVLPHFLYTQARKWDVQVCFTEVHSNPVHVTLNKDKYKNIPCANMEDCCKTEINLDNETRPQVIKVGPSFEFKAIVQNQDLQEVYGVLCQTPCSGSELTLANWTHWTIEVKREKAYGNYELFLELAPYVKIRVPFRENSKTSKKSFFLPMETYTPLKIKLLTKGKFNLDTDIKLKNMKTSETYSCIYLHTPFSHLSYHECLLVNASMWKVELTSQPRQISKIMLIKVTLGVYGSGRYSSHHVILRKLAYIPTLAGFTNIGNIRTNKADIYFNDTNNAFDILKLALTSILTGEEYGCTNLYKTVSAKYSCKLLQSKNWYLRISSPEEHEQTFAVEIIQDTLSSFSKGLIWRNHCEHKSNCVDNFHLKTYEDDKVTGLKLHFMDKPFKINEISLKHGESVYKFKATKESGTENHMVIEFSLITEGMRYTGTCLV